MAGTKNEGCLPKENAASASGKAGASGRAARTRSSSSGSGVSAGVGASASVAAVKSSDGSSAVSTASSTSGKTESATAKAETKKTGKNLYEYLDSFAQSVENSAAIKSMNNATDAINAVDCGDVVFKMKTPTDSGYNLPSKYRPGGSAFNGDLNDYCHIGVVKSVSPLRIIHMTSPTAKTDTSIGKWKKAASLKPRYISDSPQPVPEPEPQPEPTKDTATVYAETGRYVKMRKEPSTKCRLYEEVPIGATVTIVEFGYDWTKINYAGRKGWYMMTKFLIVG